MYVRFVSAPSIRWKVLLTGRERGIGAREGHRQSAERGRKAFLSHALSSFRACFVTLGFPRNAFIAGCL